MNTKRSAVLFGFLAALGARAQSPASVKEFNDRGSARYARGDLEGAISDFTAVIEMSSSLSKRGAARNNWSAADDGFANARVLDPQAAAAYLNRADAAHVAAEKQRLRAGRYGDLPRPAQIAQNIEARDGQG